MRLTGRRLKLAGLVASRRRLLLRAGKLPTVLGSLNDERLIVHRPGEIIACCFVLPYPVVMLRRGQSSNRTSWARSVRRGPLFMASGPAADGCRLVVLQLVSEHFGDGPAPSPLPSVP